MGQAVTREDRDGIAVLQLNRPEVGNAIDLELARSLGDAVAEFAGDPTVRCVLLRGAGERFCVGGDVAAMAAADDRGAFIGQLAEVAHQALLGLVSLEIPVVAVVQGAAAGAGLSLMLSADLIIAADSTSFLTAYSGVGLSPDCGMTWMLPRRVGIRRAREMLLEARRVSAPEALDWGLIDRHVAPDSLLECGIQSARALADAPYPATGLTARLLRGDLTQLSRQLDLEAAAIARSAGSTAAAPLIDRFGRRR